MHALIMKTPRKMCVRACLCSYYQTVPDEASDPELLKLGTDKSLFDDEGFLPFAQKYKESQEAFFEDYKKVGPVPLLEDVLLLLWPFRGVDDFCRHVGIGLVRELFCLFLWGFTPTHATCASPLCGYRIVLARSLGVEPLC